MFVKIEDVFYMVNNDTLKEAVDSTIEKYPVLSKLVTILDEAKEDKSREHIEHIFSQKKVIESHNEWIFDEFSKNDEIKHLLAEVPAETNTNTEAHESFIKHYDNFVDTLKEANADLTMLTDYPTLFPSLALGHRYNQLEDLLKMVKEIGVRDSFAEELDKRAEKVLSRSQMGTLGYSENESQFIYDSEEERVLQTKGDLVAIDFAKYYAKNVMSDEDKALIIEAAELAESTGVVTHEDYINDLEWTLTRINSYLKVAKEYLTYEQAAGWALKIEEINKKISDLNTETYNTRMNTLEKTAEVFALLSQVADVDPFSEVPFIGYYGHIDNPVEKFVKSEMEDIALDYYIENGLIEVHKTLEFGRWSRWSI